MASKYTYRLRAPKGLDDTLIKELQQILGERASNIHKIPGRKAVEVHGDMQTMWEILFKSRIAEDLQVKITQSFMARGEEELRKNLQKLPWACYLPLSDYQQYRLPMTRSNCHQSKLFHSQLVREILLQEINDLPIHRDYAKFKGKAPLHQLPVGFKKYKKDWLKAKQHEMDTKVKKQAEQEVTAQKQELLDDRLHDLDP